MVLLFVVCGWREEAVAGVCLRPHLVHSTYVFLVTRATKVGKIVNPAVQFWNMFLFSKSNDILYQFQRYDEG
jgi:hypothetical protein